jgi:hypothetical protein
MVGSLGNGGWVSLSRHSTTSHSEWCLERDTHPHQRYRTKPRAEAFSAAAPAAR